MRAFLVLYCAWRLSFRSLWIEVHGHTKVCSSNLETRMKWIVELFFLFFGCF